MASTNTASDDIDVAKLRKQYLDYSSAKKDEIEEQREARHYYHGDQLDAKTLGVLRKRRQPPIRSNRVGRKIDAIVGLTGRMKKDPKAYPRTPQQEQGAETATAVERYVLDNVQWDAIEPEAVRQCAMTGIGGIELSMVPGDHGDPDVDAQIVDGETFFYDPRSTRMNFTDARYMGVAKWVDLDVAQEMFPDKAEEIAGLVETGGGLEGVQLQDREKSWVNTDLKRLFLVEHWYVKSGEWEYCFYAAGIVLKHGTSEFVDEKGKTFCRFIMFSANVDHDGDRYGFVRNMKWSQDEINARRSKALHLLNTRRIIMTKGAVDDVEKVRNEAIRPDGVIEVNPMGVDAKDTFRFDDAATDQAMRGQLEFLQEAKNEIENFGFNPALIGTGVQDMSGRAIQLQQQAGIAELGPFVVSWRGWKLRTYRAIWNLVQRFWTSERWIRVTDDEGLAQFLQVNRMELDQYGNPTLADHLGSLDVDIILDEGEDTINIQQDVFETLTKMGSNVPWPVIVEVSDLPVTTKKKILAMFEQMNTPDPEKAAMEKANAQATIGATKARAYKDFAGAQKALAEVGAMPSQIHAPGMTTPEPEQPEGPKPPSVSIAFKDMPPEAQSQALMQAGIFIHPDQLAAHAQEQAKQQMAMKAQQRSPQPA